MKSLAVRGKERGNVADIMTAGIFLLAMAVLMLAFMDITALVHRKAEVSQIARKYILRMETTGGLSDGDRTSLLQELGEQGVTEADLGVTTGGPVGYGEPVYLEIRGKIGGSYGFVEKRMSTAKY